MSTASISAPTGTRPFSNLLSFSRFSLINSLVDYSVGAALGVDVGQQRWLFDLATWKGEVDGSVTNSATIRLMTPDERQ